jgi:hypothetical protein
MTSVDEALGYRTRVIAMYQQYCPEKPLSHVDFLLAKYKGYENELMEVLREKYGPEPVLGRGNTYQSQLASALQSDSSPAQLDAMLRPFRGMEEAMLYQLTNETPAVDGVAASSGAAERSFLKVNWDEDRGELFRRRQEQFRHDMADMARQKQLASNAGVLESINEAQAKVSRQEREIASLRSDLQALKAQHESTSTVLQEETRAVAGELARAKLQLLRLQTAAIPGQAPVQKLVELEREGEKVSMQISDVLRTLHVYEKVIRTHLALFPITPVRSQLRSLDAALCARLDTL